MFPPEILERILYNCDGRTLSNAKRVNTTWKQMVEYISKKSDVWKKCCFKDIPAEQINLYGYKWMDSKLTYKIKWQNIYENWLAWYDIKSNIAFEKVMSFPAPKISCIASARNYIAIGYENGVVKIFKGEFELILTLSHLNICVTGVNIVCDDDKEAPTDILVCYRNGVIYINDFFNDSYLPIVVYECQVYSIYKNYICGVSGGGKISVIKIKTDTVNKRKGYDVITHLRIYSPSIVSCCSIWDGKCTLLINSQVKHFTYNEKSPHVNLVPKKKTDITFWGKNHIGLEHKFALINNDIIIALSYDSNHQQIVELFIMGDKDHSKKMFSPWQTFFANITCLYLYGNTFVIGTDSGVVYFYEISNWKLFDIKNHKHKEVVSQAPILAIDSVEMIGRRIFYIATTFDIHQLIGYNINEDNLRFIQIE